MPQIDEITIRDIAFAEDLHPVYVAKVMRTKGAPKSTRKIGPTLMFNSSQVLAFLEKRRKKFARK